MNGDREVIIAISEGENLYFDSNTCFNLYYDQAMLFAMKLLYNDESVYI